MIKLQKTHLNELHLDLGAKMVNFANFSMPVQYSTGIIKEHIQTREQSSIFDVSHMGQFILKGKTVAKQLEQILPINVLGMLHNRQRYGFFTLENGGVLDDLMLTRIDEQTFYMVINASRKEQGLSHLNKNLSQVEIVELKSNSLIAVQGPNSSKILNQFFPEVSEMKFMDSKEFKKDGEIYRISRSGYSGEDGFELSIPSIKVTGFVKELLANNSSIKMAGLGARDSLRLEAGLCLYGNDLNEHITPIEANLSWAIQKVRKTGGEREGGFIGSDIILGQIKNGCDKKRVGFIINGKIPVRIGATILNANNNEVGKITSGGFGATINKPIAMGYLKTELIQPEAKFKVLVRKKEVEIEIMPLPFIKHNYFH